MTRLTLCAPAKLNLFLHITGRREDGYHTLQTVFQLLDHGDQLTFTVRDDPELRLTLHGRHALGELPPGDNLVIRAARALRAYASEHGGKTLRRGVDIALHKCLPAGGGLGGGSSDAATTLLGLNRLWDLNLDIDTLADIGLALGADVPVFVRGHCAWAEGIGDELTPITLPERWYLVVHPGCHIATSVIFSHPQLTRDTPAITMAAFFTGPTRNDCENLVRHLAKPVDKALIFLQKFGEVRMTGSGASVFIAFDSEAQAHSVASQIPGDWHAFVARGVNRSPAWDQLSLEAS